MPLCNSTIPSSDQQRKCRPKTSHGKLVAGFVFDTVMLSSQLLKAHSRGNSEIPAATGDESFCRDACSGGESLIDDESQKSLVELQPGHVYQLKALAVVDL